MYHKRETNIYVEEVALVLFFHDTGFTRFFLKDAWNGVSPTCKLEMTKSYWGVGSVVVVTSQSIVLFV